MGGNVLAGTYDARLVALSLIIAIGASHVALELAARVTAAKKSSGPPGSPAGPSAWASGSGPCTTSDARVQPARPGLLRPPNGGSFDAGRGRRLVGGSHPRQSHPAASGRCAGRRARHGERHRRHALPGDGGDAHAGDLPVERRDRRALVAVAVLVSLVALWLAFRFRTESKALAPLKLASAVLMGARSPACTTQAWLQRPSSRRPRKPWCPESRSHRSVSSAS